MAKRVRHLPISKHKPLRSSWYAIDMQPNEPIVLPVYHTTMGKALLVAQSKKNIDMVKPK